MTAARVLIGASARNEISLGATTRLYMKSASIFCPAAEKC
jgi:hypothetical protein